MARLRQLGNVAAMFLKQHMNDRENQYQSQLIQGRESALRDQMLQNNLLEKILQDPKLTARLKNGGLTRVGGMDITPFAQTPDQAAGEVAKGIAGADNPNKVYTDADILGLNAAEPGANRGPQNPQIAALMQQANAKRGQQMSLLAPHELKQYNTATGAEETNVIPGSDYLKGGTFQAGPTPTQAGVNAGTQANAAAPGLIQAANATEAGERDQKVKTAGAEAGARAAANFPWEQKLAQTRADLSLANQTALDTWKAAHPRATAAQVDQKAGADHAIEMIGETRQLMDEMERRGMMGPLVGKGAQIASGTLKAEALFPNPDDAKLAATYFTEMGLLSKLAARVHGGTRAAASPQMAAMFDKIISGTGDRSIVTGQLDGVERVMKIYTDDPNAPPLLAIPGYTDAPKNPMDGLDPSVIELLNRPKGGAR